ncbi:hypothetical protein N7541_002627 [Penicillium brevicompactum]|uniref:Uncharacterized protein n=1 Tax=Penicillium brevicompactum TaxID=5074 RepID=A0A9W9RQ65_PENBR|nr:hypothetical protein N7541_002627 [Penicillium brevicompactum]
MTRAGTSTTHRSLAMSTEMARRGLRIHHSVDGYWGRKEASGEAKEDGEDEENVVKMEGAEMS